MNTLPTTSHELSAYRQSQSLVLGVYEVTDCFPRHADDRLIQRLRFLTTTISGLILEGCARLDAAGSRRAWQDGAGLLEELAETLDRADCSGFLHKDHMLELLELQSGALVDLLILLGSLPGATSPVDSSVTGRRLDAPLALAA